MKSLLIIGAGGQIPKEYAGIASGITNTMHQLGGPFGLAIIGSLATNFYSELWMMTFFTLLGNIVVAIFISSLKNKI